VKSLFKRFELSYRTDIWDTFYTFLVLKQAVFGFSGTKAGEWPELSFSLKHFIGLIDNTHWKRSSEEPIAVWQSAREKPHEIVIIH
jgi:hypothetical protein